MHIGSRFFLCAFGVITCGHKNPRLCSDVRTSLLLTLSAKLHSRRNHHHSSPPPGAQSTLPFTSLRGHPYKVTASPFTSPVLFLCWQSGQTDLVSGSSKSERSPWGLPVPVTGLNKLLDQSDPKRQAATSLPAEGLGRPQWESRHRRCHKPSGDRQSSGTRSPRALC